MEILRYLLKVYQLAEPGFEPASFSPTPPPTSKPSSSSMGSISLICFKSSYSLHLHCQPLAWLWPPSSNTGFQVDLPSTILQPGWSFFNANLTMSLLLVNCYLLSWWSLNSVTQQKCLVINLPKEPGEITWKSFLQQGCHLLHTHGTALVRVPRDSTTPTLGQLPGHTAIKLSGSSNTAAHPLFGFFSTLIPIPHLVSPSLTGCSFSLSQDPGLQPLLSSVYTHFLNESVHHHGFKSHLYNKVFKMWLPSPNLSPELQAQISLLGCLMGISNLTWPKTTDPTTDLHTSSPSQCTPTPSF